MSDKHVIVIFFFFYLILPEYFAFEISSSFPLLTAGRVLILLLLAWTCYSHHGKLHVAIHNKALCLYFAVMIIINIFHLTDCFSESFKTIFSLVFEQWMLIILVLNALNTRDKFEYAIEALVWGNFLVGILGVIETISGENLFYFLTTTSRSMLQSSQVRLGMRRAEGPFGNSVYFGIYCVCMIPFSLYLYETKRQRRFLLIVLINILGVLCSGSRAQILVLALMLAYAFLKKRKSLKMDYLKYILGLIPLATIILLIAPSLRAMLLNTTKSVFNALGFAYELTNFGTNTLGWESRIWQFSGFIQLIRKQALLFGLGAECHLRGQVEYLWNGVWTRIESFDVGFVSIGMQYGVIGLFVYMVLLCRLIKKSLKLSDRYETNNMNNAFLVFHIAYFLGLFSTVGVERMWILIIALQLAYIKYNAYNENANIIKEI